MKTHRAGDGDEHEVLAGPDVQVVRGYPELRIASGRLDLLRLDVELAPEGVDVVLAVVHLDVLHHVVADGRVSAVGTDHEVKVDLDFPRSARGGLGGHDLEPGLPMLEVGACQLVAEEELDVRHALQDVEEPFVEASSVNGEDGLGGGQLLQQRGRSDQGMRTLPWTS